MVFWALRATLVAVLRSSAALHLENLALRHQFGVLQRSVKRPKLTAADRFFWARLSSLWADWRAALIIVKPETVIAWYRKGFRLFWTWKVRRGKPGRPVIPKDGRELIRRLSREDPLGERREFTANFSNSALSSERPVTARTRCVSVGRLPRLGARKAEVAKTCRLSLRLRCVKRFRARFGPSKAAKTPNRINKLIPERYLDTVEVRQIRVLPGPPSHLMRQTPFDQRT